MAFGASSKNKDEAKGATSRESEQKHSEDVKASSKGTTEGQKMSQPMTGSKNKDDKAGEGDNPDPGKKPKEVKFGHHLTPEELEIAYDLRANIAHRLESQNNNLEAELNLHRNVKALRRKQQQRPYSCRIATGTGISQHNMKLLMKSYEKKAKEAEEKINQLEKELEESRSLAKRYHDMYMSEKEKSARSANTQPPESPKTVPKSSPRGKAGKGSPETKDSEKKGVSSKQNASQRDQSKGSPDDQLDSSRSGKQDNEKVTEDHLDDDEALFKRHIARIADTKSMRTTSPIRVQDVIRKNEVLIQENEALKNEIQRLKWDNAQLVKKVKLASADKDKLLHMISTSEAARKELIKRLEKEVAKNQKLSKSLTRQAADWIQLKKALQEMDDKRKLAMLFPMSTSELDAQERTYSHPVKKNVYFPRYMFPVEQYAQANRPA